MMKVNRELTRTCPCTHIGLRGGPEGPRPCSPTLGTSLAAAMRRMVAAAWQLHPWSQPAPVGASRGGTPCGALTRVLKRQVY